MVVGAELTAPQPLAIGSSVSVQDAAACLALAKSDIVTTHRAPQVVSVGLPFLAVELASREALRRAKPNFAAHERILPSIGTDAVYSYCRGASDQELHARTFAPLDASIEDPATGSATAATIALLASLRPGRDAEIAWRANRGRHGTSEPVVGRHTEARRSGSCGAHCWSSSPSHARMHGCRLRLIWWTASFSRNG